MITFTIFYLIGLILTLIIFSLFDKDDNLEESSGVVHVIYSVLWPLTFIASVIGLLLNLPRWTSRKK